MSNITWIMGNGFDRQLGLKTGYKDFYEYYLEKRSSDTDAITNFKKVLKVDKNTETWADFELEYGNYSKKCAYDNDDYSLIKADAEQQLILYLTDIQESIDWSAINSSHKRSFTTSVLDWIKELKQIPHDKIEKMLNNYNTRGQVRFLTFNYTNILHKLISLTKDDLKSYLDAKVGNRFLYDYYNVTSIGTARYLHGNLKDGIVFGVDNISQITNPNFHNNQEIISEMVKPKQLSDIQELDVNNDISSELAKNDINESAIICVFGSSIGNTDESWWRFIGKWLKQTNKLLIIFNYEGSKPDSLIVREKRRVRDKKEKYKKEILDSFKRNSGWDDDTFKANKDKIIIALNENLFNFKLPLIDVSSKKIIPS